MKIGITSAGADLTSQVDPRFGRCPYFIIIDPDTEEFEAVENPNVQAMGGAGIQSAQLVASKGAEIVLTGSCGPNAFQTLSAASVKVITGVAGTVKEAVSRFKSGQLQPTQAPNVGSHFGMGAGMGGGMGRGMGRGMGMGGGMGRGMSAGMGYGTRYPGTTTPGIAPPRMTPQGMDEKQELEFLKQQAGFLNQQIEDINKRIQELEKKK
ncbi:MAG: dinitrogenase iron-molybdenum cofactor biosynthesis protein [Candidatus Cloacimonadota bacterium]|nr:MAG: dinitrogenase iron-molybdenum cofactor biosynthesis protein [Candidatus Cloacimonadota bacterium]